MQKHIRSILDFETELTTQLGFIQRSADSYDNGYEDEAKRLATTIRVLVHDTKNSISLMTHLDRKSIKWLDSATLVCLNNLVQQCNLVLLEAGTSEPTFLAKLDSDITEKWVNFDEWWNAQIFRDVDGSGVTRKKLILTAANQDGGAHVDHRLDEDYYSFATGKLGIQIISNGSDIPMEGPHRAAIRQIAHEVLRTLIPDYSKKQKFTDGRIYLKDMTVAIAEPPDFMPHPSYTGPKVGRNEKCPCGSGKKYKHCCKP
jgi:SEC-C motif